MADIVIAVLAVTYLGAGLLAARLCYGRWRPSSVPLCGKGEDDKHGKTSAFVCRCGHDRLDHRDYLCLRSHCNCQRWRPVQPGHIPACYRRPHTMSVPLPRSLVTGVLWPLAVVVLAADVLSQAAGRALVAAVTGGHQPDKAEREAMQRQLEIELKIGED